MRFALVNNERVLAEPNLQGLCPGCAQPVVSRCGKYRIWHWAHRGKKTCDRWWEPETEWHRAWKDNFPRDWQEYIQHDSSGEKHTADVRTEHGVILEFQHSHLDPQERAAREGFYENMAWVVDGTRLKKDYQNFSKGKINFKATIVKRFFLCAEPEECFNAGWLESPAPVIFDFRGTAPAGPADEAREPLWCLLPGRSQGKAVVVEMSRTDFVALASRSLNLAYELTSTLMRESQAAVEIIRQYQQRARPQQRPMPRLIRRGRGRL